jgi:hypothetical protein
MTGRLLTARPVYAPADHGRRPGLPAVVETMLGIPVALTSTGPATTDKRQRRPLRRAPTAAPAA